ncbi:uncharacterized protein [Mytilus edulis]|uniref:uncharacterized protein n=1 Tax=Mytilus edulis TaxID=6550 RepID=UPI0039EDF7D1
MHIGKPGPEPDSKYTLKSTILQKVTEEKDIGVIIDAELNFEKHISEKVNKANSMFALLRRTFQYLDTDTFVPLYKTLVRTHLEFASSVWHPYKIKYVDMIENVQRRATKQLPGLKNLTYSERLQKLKLPSLNFRRVRGDMIELYKTLNGKYDKEAAQFVKLWKDMDNTNRVTRQQSENISTESKNRIKEECLCSTSVKTWNTLPEIIVTSPTTNTFKNRLDKYWKNQTMMYEDYKSPITGSGEDLDIETDD